MAKVVDQAYVDALIERDAKAGYKIKRTFVDTFPPRMVIDVLYYCSECGEEYTLWMTSDSIWERLPRNLHKAALCVGCFKIGVPSDIRK
jgi:hypothetical protein